MDEDDSAKKPLSSAFRVEVEADVEADLDLDLPTLSGESGSATIEPAARGDEALGRVELRRDSGPPPDRAVPFAAGTPRDEEDPVAEVVAGAEGPIRPKREEPASPEAEGVDKLAALGGGGGKPKLIPVKEDGKVILACSSSSISGKSSSLAEYLPPPGVAPLELPAEATCVLFVVSVLARRLDEPRGKALSARGAYVDLLVLDFSLGDGAVSIMVGTEGIAGVVSGDSRSTVDLRLFRRPLSFVEWDVSMAASLRGTGLLPFPLGLLLGVDSSALLSLRFNRLDRRGVGCGEGSRSGSGSGVRSTEVMW